MLFMFIVFDAIVFYGLKNAASRKFSVRIIFFFSKNLSKRAIFLFFSYTHIHTHTPPTPAKGTGTISLARFPSPFLPVSPAGGVRVRLRRVPDIPITPAVLPPPHQVTNRINKIIYEEIATRVRVHYAD